MFVEETSATQISWRDNGHSISVNDKTNVVIGIKEHINEMKCVAKCDKFVLNGTCIDICPDSFPFEKNGSCDNYTCESFYYKRESNKAHIQCIPRCYSGDVSLEYQCLKECPESAYQYGERCFMSCPSEAPVIEINITSKCKEKSPCNDVLRQKTCIKFCSKTLLNMSGIANCVDICPPPLLEYKKRCVKTCPPEAPIINNIFVIIQQWIHDIGWKFKSSSKSFNECVVSCDVKGKPFDKNKNICTSKCPSRLPFISGNKCSPGCNEAMLRNNESFGIECVHECPKGKSNIHGHCLDPASCVDENAYEYGGRCVTSCPKDRPFGLNGNRSCIANCGKDYLFSNGNCINEYNCNDSMVVFEGQCLGRCPHGYGIYDTCYHMVFFVLSVILCFSLLIVYSFLGRRIFKEYFIVMRMLTCTSRPSSNPRIHSKSIETCGLELEDNNETDSFGIDSQGFGDDVPLLRPTRIVDTSVVSYDAQTSADVHAKESEDDEALVL